MSFDAELPAIQTAIARMLGAIDALDWPALGASFAPAIDTDYTSLWGGEPATLSPEELLASWKDLAFGFDATQHLVGPVVVRERRGDEAIAETTVRAYHHLSGQTWMVSGGYVFRMRRTGGEWLIAGITLHTYYQEGDRDLPRLARERGASSQRAPRARASLDR